MLIISSAGHLSVLPCGLSYPNIQGFGILTPPAFLAVSSTVSLRIQCVCMPSHFSRVRLFVTPWTIAHQALLSMGFSRQEYWGGLPPPGNLPDPEIGTHEWGHARALSSRAVQQGHSFLRVDQGICGFPSRFSVEAFP